MHGNLKNKLKTIQIRGFHKTDLFKSIEPDLLLSTNFLDENATIAERVYCVINDIHSKVKCKCGKSVKYGYISPQEGTGYRKSCSIKCHNKIMADTIKEQNRQKHHQKVCKVCGKETTFYNGSKIRTAGYADYCSTKCANSCKGVIKKRIKSKKLNISKRKQDLENWIKSIPKETELSTAEISQKFPSYNRTYLRNLLAARNIKYKKYDSAYEIDWKSKLGEGWERNYRPKFMRGMEIDLYNEEHQIGFEIHGLVYHSTLYRPNKNYHKEKFLRAQEGGIKLYQFYTHELNKKSNICLSMLRGSIEGHLQKYDARKCTLVEIDSSTANKFYNENHLQGGIQNRGTHIALHYKDQIICCLSFGENRFGEGLEIYRFANKVFSNCRGGFSKLLKIVINNNTGPIYSFSDCRYSTGNLYKSCGFSFIRHTKPGYFYITTKSPIDVKSRYSMQKHKMHKILGDSFNPNLTEEENALNSGYYRVYDAGQFVWSLG